VTAETVATVGDGWVALTAEDPVVGPATAVLTLDPVAVGFEDATVAPVTNAAEAAVVAPVIDTLPTGTVPLVAVTDIAANVDGAAPLILVDWESRVVEDCAVIDDDLLEAVPLTTEEAPEGTSGKNRVLTKAAPETFGTVTPVRCASSPI